MGEEWGAAEPFPFFCDFEGELADAVRQGRKREFAEAYARHGSEIPDPLARETRELAVLDWSSRAEPAHAARLTLTRELLRVRRENIIPLLPAMIGKGQASLETGRLSAEWPAGRATLMLLANLSDVPKPAPAPLQWGEPVWNGPPPATLPPWSVYVAVKG